MFVHLLEFGPKNDKFGESGIVNNVLPYIPPRYDWVVWHICYLFHDSVYLSFAKFIGLNGFQSLASIFGCLLIAVILHLISALCFGFGR
jgi:hypothetical protein